MKLADSKRSGILLIFSALLASFILFTFYVQRKIIEHSEDSTYAKVLYEDRNSSIFGRKLASGRGDYFLDIHYSNPTARFQMPQLGVLPPSYELWAIHHGSGCPNAYSHTNGLEQKFLSPEVCLTLNIYRCQQIEGDGLQPVLVYLNEGNWLGRSDANLEPQTTIHNLACRGLIIVSVNYRMGVYGFYSPLAGGNAKNFGLHDVETALQWINANVAHFGGHPKHITVMGRGIGAQLASFLSTSQAGKNSLFRRLVLLSGFSHAPNLFESDDKKYTASASFAKTANCLNENQLSSLVNGTLSRKEKTEIDACVGALSQEAIIQAEASSPVFPSSQWKIVNEAGLNQVAETNFKTPALPVLMGLCHRPVKKPTFPTGFKPTKSASQLELVLREKLEQMAAFNTSFGDSSKGLDYYLDLFKQEEYTAKDEKELFDEAIEKIKFDILKTGPMILEAFQRWNKPNSARIYIFDYEAPWWLNRSELDVASTGEKILFDNITDLSLQLPCLDDLLFNPVPEGKLVHSAELGTNSNISPTSKLIDTSYHQKHIAETFATYLANFVTYGDPNIGVEDETSAVPAEWPTVSFEDFDGVERKDVKKTKQKLQVLRLNDRKGVLIDDFVEIDYNKLNFWLCQVASACSH